ncbi:uncharacterized protein EAF02_008619 [Botrytis sinoallii]|uniref:uncharacterized protein n=1 Tax=Botrytis sinoallii TaxID=1463999 RepID=UPI001902404C|nr:uncharacterized protein EAF02_008619 [Botrytis sinoallii]KAF7874642.1 hypothetical protein EAF02_008619 [Botrytis sinoallii]
MSHFFHDAKAAIGDFVHEVESEVSKAAGISDGEKHSHTHIGEACHALHINGKENRYGSFAPPRTGHDIKWHIDGCAYMWAVSVALEEAQESIWILDWWLTPELYLRRPPSANEEYRIDRMLLAAAERGVKVNIIIYKEVTKVLTLCSEHTKKALEVHPNISVFRHPDHVPSGIHLESELITDLKNFSLRDFDLAQLPKEGIEALYGARNDVILYWAHHEKLCLVDSKVAFMGGLDLCFGRWDVNQHPIADAHPSDLDNIVFPGQDFNNARVYDFQDVENWQENKLDRTKYSRMGWSDLSMSLTGPVVEDLRAHFVQRWNFIFREKYDTQDTRYTALSLIPNDIPDGYYNEDGTNVGSSTEGAISDTFRRAGTFFGRSGGNSGYGDDQNGVSIQLVRSCTEWSNGVATEHSIANAYIEVIQRSQHFIYIENQFFITACSDEQNPVENKIGAAIADRIIRAYQNGEQYKVIVCMPAVPAFAGDLHADDALGTRAIMEYQYNSICRGGNSIMETVAKAGVPDPKDYIRFYNLRNYDRLNDNGTMARTEEESGVSYESARKEHDDIVGAGYGGYGEETGARRGQENYDYDQYQRAAPRSQEQDTVAACYLEDGPSITSIPWNGTPEAELDAFVSEELYIHTKLLIADDRVVICGSANLNDRSQLGTHDSEIAIVIEDTETVDSYMDGREFRAAKYATSLRRQLFRKHLGMIAPQDWTRPDANYMPINKDPNDYDWGSDYDIAVQDVFSPEFTDLWNGRARTNTEVYSKVFHAIPADNVRNWDDYHEFYEQYFVSPSDKDTNEEDKEPARYLYGHVVKEEFPGGVEEVKEELSRVKGMLVEMPLLFMDGVDFAKEGLSFNALTETIYT